MQKEKDEVKLETIDEKVNTCGCTHHPWNTLSISVVA